MMSKTHLAVGIATSLAVIRPQTIQGCAITVIGGAVGGVLADNDILDNDYQADALIGQLLAFGITAIVIVLDYFFQLGICSSIYTHPLLPIIGGIGFVILYIIGFLSEHRTFTHSFLALILYTLTAWLIYKPIALAVSVAYLSHILLGVLNKRKVPVLYPLEFGICLKLCYANKTANKAFMYVGLGASVVLLAVCLILSIT